MITIWYSDKLPPDLDGSPRQTGAISIFANVIDEHTLEVDHHLTENSLIWFNENVFSSPPKPVLTSEFVRYEDNGAHIFRITY
jgi:hypothetical protein